MAAVARPEPSPPLWPHQQAALDFIRARPGAMLAMGMGTGKSRCAIAAIRDLPRGRALILAPRSVVAGVWPEQWERYGDGRSLAALTGELGNAARRIAQGSAADVVVINYESAWRPPLANWLLRQPWQLLALDESHRIKSPGSRASRFSQALARRIPWRIALTGTPMPHSPLDIYAQCRALDPRIFGGSWARFRDYYACRDNPAIPQQITGYRNLDDLQRRFAAIAYQVSAEDALDLPPTLDSRRYCRLSAKARRVYEQLAQDFIAEVQEGTITAANVLTRLLRLQQITSGYAALEDGATVGIDTGKERLLADLVDENGPAPLVAFCRFRYDLDVIRLVAQEQNRPVAEISGRTEAGAELKRWREEGGVLATQIQAGGSGLDLTAARTAVYYSLGYSLGDYLQSRARLHRPGQTGSVRYVHLVAADTVDTRVYAALERRQQVVETVLAGVAGVAAGQRAAAFPDQRAAAVPNG